MDQRDFMKAATTLLASAALQRTDFAQASGAENRARMVLPMNRGWRYSPSFVESGHEIDFDDSEFAPVVVPHTNLALPWHGFDDKTYEFVSLYRRRFKLPPEARGQRVFVDFEGVMTASTVWINGTRLGEYKGGYTPFSFELTPHLDFDGQNLLAVDVDSSERADIPPFGYEIDYLTFGGIYREVALRIVPSTFIENIFARPKDVLSASPSVDLDCYVEHLQASKEVFTIEVELLDGDRVIAKASHPVASAGAPSEPLPHTLRLDRLSGIKLWSLEERNLYSTRVRLRRGTQLLDQDSRRFAFREAQFTDDCFEINGKVSRLRVIDGHHTFPFVGQAMPGRVQRRDALILRNQLKCNIAR